jgi:hypothetical protein
LLRFARGLVQFFSLILWAAAGLAFLAEWSVPGEGMARIGVAIVAVIVVSSLFSFWQEYRVEQTLAALRKLLPQNVKLMRDGKVVLGAVELAQTWPSRRQSLDQGASCDSLRADGYRRSFAALKRGGLLCACGYTASLIDPGTSLSRSGRRPSRAEARIRAPAPRMRQRAGRGATAPSSPRRR